MLDRSFSPDSTCPAIALATAELHPFFPNLLPAFIFLLRKKINAIQILKNISMHRYICHFLLPTRIGNRAKNKLRSYQSKESVIYIRTLSRAGTASTFCSHCGKLYEHKYLPSELPILCLPVK